MSVYGAKYIAVWYYAIRVSAVNNDPIANETERVSTLSLCLCNAKRWVTSRVRAVRHCPPNEVMPADRTSRSHWESLESTSMSYNAIKGQFTHISGTRNNTWKNHDWIRWIVPLTDIDRQCLRTGVKGRGDSRLKFSKDYAPLYPHVRNYMQRSLVFTLNVRSSKCNNMSMWWCTRCTVEI